MYLRSHSNWLLIRQLLMDVPKPNGSHCIEQIRHSLRKSQLTTEEWCITLGANCHTGVFSGMIKSLVHALGTDSSMTEPTINSTLYTFIEQSTSMIFRRWSYSLPYVLYPLCIIPIWFTPCIIKT